MAARVPRALRPHQAVCRLRRRTWCSKPGLRERDPELTRLQPLGAEQVSEDAEATEVELQVDNRGWAFRNLRKVRR